MPITTAITSFKGAFKHDKLTVIWTLNEVASVSLSYYYLDICNNTVNIPNTPTPSVSAMPSSINGFYTFDLHDGKYISVTCAVVDNPYGDTYTLASFNPSRDSDSESDDDDIRKVYKKTKKIYRKTKKILSILETPK